MGSIQANRTLGSAGPSGMTHSTIGVTVYILIAIMFFYPSGTSSVVAEFNTKEACLAAASEMQKGYGPNKVFCAAKGEKK